MTCQKCGREMKVLFTNYYCECDGRDTKDTSPFTIEQELYAAFQDNTEADDTDHD